MKSEVVRFFCKKNPHIERLNDVQHPIFSGFNIFDKIAPKNQKAIFATFGSLGNRLRINLKLFSRYLLKKKNHTD